MIIFNSENEFQTRHGMKTSYNLKIYFKCRQIAHLITKSWKKVLLKESKINSSILVFFITNYLQMTVL